MSYKSMLLALLVLSLSGCAVYGGGSGYGHRGYDRGHSNTYYQVQRYPVYVVPQPRYEAYHHDGRRYDEHRHPPRYYVPAAQPRHYQSNQYHKRHDYRVAQPYAGWDGRRDRDYSRNNYHQQRAQRHDAQRGGERRGDDRRDERKGWERQRN